MDDGPDEDGRRRLVLGAVVVERCREREDVDYERRADCREQTGLYTSRFSVQHKIREPDDLPK